METNQQSLFDKGMARYQAGDDLEEVIKDFEVITDSIPNHSAAWTCLAWLQLLCDRNEEALRSARIAVKLTPQDPQARINLSLSLLETKNKGVRDHIDFVRKVLFTVPEYKKELKESLEDGLIRKPNWHTLIKIKEWLDI